MKSGNYNNICNRKPILRINKILLQVVPPNIIYKLRCQYLLALSRQRIIYFCFNKHLQIYINNWLVGVMVNAPGYKAEGFFID